MKKILYIITLFISFAFSANAQPYAPIYRQDMIVCSGRADNYANDLSNNSQLTAEMISLMRAAYYKGCMDQRIKNTDADLEKKAKTLLPS